ARPPPHPAGPSFGVATSSSLRSGFVPPARGAQHAAGTQSRTAFPAELSLVLIWVPRYEAPAMMARATSTSMMMYSVAMTPSSLPNRVLKFSQATWALQNNVSNYPPPLSRRGRMIGCCATFDAADDPRQLRGDP